MIPPANMSLEKATSLPHAWWVAHQMTEKIPDLPMMKYALVHVAGSSTSLALIQFLKLKGLKVIATSTSDEKLLQAKLNGAHRVLNIHRQPKFSKPISYMIGD